MSLQFAHAQYAAVLIGRPTDNGYRTATDPFVFQAFLNISLFHTSTTWSHCLK
jgi:hypothetical protein